MTHPTPQAVRAVADKLEAADRKYNVEINMNVVSAKQECGTVCCHAGLYALACLDRWNKHTGCCAYSDGAELLAEKS